MKRKPVASPPPFKSVLCAVDFSIQSEVALRYAATVAARARGRLDALYVNDPTLVAAAAIELGDRGLAAASRKELQHLVERTLGKPPQGVTIRFLSETGEPARTIAAAAARMKSSLIVTGTHGLSGVNKVLLGSTTERLLHVSPVPILMVPPYLSEAPGPTGPAPGWPGPAITVPLDLSRESAADLTAAASLARSWGVELLVVHVVPQRAAPPWYRADLSAQIRLQIEKAKMRIDGLVAGVAGVKIEVRVPVGSPADELSAIAAEARVGLVMMQVRRGPGIFGARAGTLAYHVLRQTVTPVLAVPEHARRPFVRR